MEKDQFQLATTYTRQGTVPARASDSAFFRFLPTALRNAIVAAILVLAHLSSLGCSATVVLPKKPRQKVPWEWTVDERLAARFDPQGAAERRTKGATEPYGFRDVEANPPEVNVVIGGRNPELLLPWEVFGYLIENAYPSDETRSQPFRSTLEAGGSLPRDLWERLSSCLSRYLAERTVEEALVARAAPTDPSTDADFRSRIQELHRRRCESRQIALACARRQLGKEEFDRFLYERVAPKVFSLWDGDAASLRFIEGGCR